MVDRAVPYCCATPVTGIEIVLRSGSLLTIFKTAGKVPTCRGWKLTAASVTPLGASKSGPAGPAVYTAVLSIVIDCTLSVALPLFRISNSCSFSELTASDPKSIAEILTEISGVGASPTPFPSIFTTNEGFAGSVLTKVNVPDWLPGTGGEK